MFFRVLAGIFLALVPGLALAAPPNVVVFLVDDMGWQDTSVAFARERTPFNEHFRTPSMARLAARGICFTEARAHPVCTPTRVAILTGQHPARHRATNWILFPDKDTSDTWGPTASPKGWRMEGLNAEDVTLPKLLREAGYMTIHAGKGHWGAVGTSGEDPLKLGFDVNIGGHTAGSPGSYQGADDYGNKPGAKDAKVWGVPGLAAYHGTETHLTDALTEEVKKALGAAVKSGKPFYLNFAHYAVHKPIQPHARFMEHYAGKKYAGTDIDIPQVEAEYASMIEGMDASLGAVLDALEALGVAENTLVLFLSDNGGLSAQTRGTTPRGTGLNTHCWPAKAGKGSAYEGGTRIPFIAAWAKPDANAPAQAALPIAAGARSAQPIIVEDLFPTLLGVAGASERLPAGHLVDGRDLRPYLAQTAADPERPLYFHYPHVWGPHGPGYEPHSAGVFGAWKVIYFYTGQRWELYHLADDLGEEHDLAKAEPERLNALAAKLVEGLRGLGAQWPTDRATGAELPPVLPGR